MDGAVSVFADGFGRPQGLAFDKDGNLYVAEGLLGESGIYRLSSDGEKEQVVSGPPLVGMAFHEDGSAVLAGMHAVFRIELGIEPQRSF
jgi:sugar lactone lactonase YvrE